MVKRKWGLILWICLSNKAKQIKQNNLENVLVYLNVSGVATVLNFPVYSYQICETLDAGF